ncbi:MAG: phosphatidylglycerol lysyltransferase domain-containing protein [Prevotellaceae bacterium]|nr:phosphatidylglycerol lysyltransferase domain-containing protein [Prevotellaceae bacterium]
MSNNPIIFEDISPADKDEITRYTLRSPRRTSDISFSNLCSWRFMYATQYAIADDFLLLKFYADGTRYYLLPVGEGDKRHIIERLMEDARIEGQPFRMLGVYEEAIGELNTLFPQVFRFHADRDYSDYIYLRTDLATLPGKKLQPKRNHVNKFRRTYAYEYLPLTADRVQECLVLEEVWCRMNNCDQQEGTGNERRALVYALEHFDELGLSGGLLHVDGQIVAFTFGMPINGDTFGVHVEKADTRYDGAYAMMNYEFANHIPQQYTYVNREEDLGLEGLRRAKLSYQPAILLTKYEATLI